MRFTKREEGNQLEKGLNITETNSAWYINILVGNEITRTRLPKNNGAVNTPYVVEEISICDGKRKVI